MCTLTWTPAVEGRYSVWFNRDELRSRLPALPPRVWTERAIPFVAPTDGDAGGTWIAVNAQGLTVCLLNHFAADAARPAEDILDPRAFVSRGRLVVDLMDSRSVDQVAEQLEPDALRGRYRPFDLVALDPGGAIARLTWDGERLACSEAEQVRPPIASSGFQPVEVAAVRALTYTQLVPATATENQIEAFHRSHLPERGAYSVCMHRPEARTVSLSHIRVETDQVHFRYGDGPACRTFMGAPLSLAR